MYDRLNQIQEIQYGLLNTSLAWKGLANSGGIPVKKPKQNSMISIPNSKNQRFDQL